MGAAPRPNIFIGGYITIADARTKLAVFIHEICDRLPSDDLSLAIALASFGINAGLSDRFPIKPDVILIRFHVCNDFFASESAAPFVIARLRGLFGGFGHFFSSYRFACCLQNSPLGPWPRGFMHWPETSVWDRRT